MQSMRISLTFSCVDCYWLVKWDGGNGCCATYQCLPGNLETRELGADSTELLLDFQGTLRSLLVIILGVREGLLIQRKLLGSRTEPGIFCFLLVRTITIMSYAQILTRTIIRPRHVDLQGLQTRRVRRASRESFCRGLKRSNGRLGFLNGFLPCLDFGSIRVFGAKFQLSCGFRLDRFDSLEHQSLSTCASRNMLKSTYLDIFREYALQILAWLIIAELCGLLLFNEIGQ